MSSPLSSYLPQQPGLLPLWLLFVGTISIANSVQTYITMSFTRRLYCGPRPPNAPWQWHVKEDPQTTHSTPLQARTFGTYTFVVGLIRFYAAYNLDNPAFYQLALWTYVVAGLHFFSEWLYFRSTRFAQSVISSLIISPLSVVWMLSQQSYYVEQ